MESETLDAVARSLFRRRSRRAAAGLLGGLLALPLLGGAQVDAKRKKRKRRKGGGKKGGGGNGGAACVPKCGGATPVCGVGDGCGGTCVCAAGSICARGGLCYLCDIIHDGNDVTSGEALRQKMAIPIDDDSYVYVCPGRYEGYFVHAGGNLIGAGDGADPATNTILDAAGRALAPGAPRGVVAVASGATSRLAKMRITGSTRAFTHGVRVPPASHLTMESCTVTGNRGSGSCGIDSSSSFELVGCTISDNGSTEDVPNSYFGGGIRAANPQVSDIINSRIVGNVAGGFGGGGLYAEGGPLNIFNTEISGNRVLNAIAKGGGIYQVSGTIRLRGDTRITGNTAGASGGGGGIYREGGEITWEGPDVSRNVPNNCVNVSQCVG